MCETPNPPGSVYCDGCGVNLSMVQGMPDAPPPETLGNGRYRVQRLLGEGANKKVYLAHDTVLERDVALSLLKQGGLGFWRVNPAATGRMLDEAKLIARLGDHPYIVSVYDVGEENGRTYLVCQLMTGGDLQGLLDHAPDHRLAVTRAVAIADQLLQGLEHAHQHGIIHRDLKPANVWLTQEGDVKIGDLGLATRHEPGPLQLAGVVVGTVAFMAPEQAAGEIPDERSDLYSVGAILYAMLAGRPPFIGDDTAAVIEQHLHAPPVALRWFDPTVPLSVERFVLRLLAKEPDLRPPSAHAARAALQAIAWALEHGTSPGGPALLTPGDEQLNLHEGMETDVFVGRQAEMELLRELADGAFRGDGRLVLVRGDAGIGKTRLAQELTTYARMSGAEVLWGHAREDENVGYEPWVQILSALVRWLDADSLSEFTERRGGDLGRIVPSLAQRLPEFARSPYLDVEESRRRLFDAAAGFLFAAAQRQPLLLVFDDLHWADPASLQLLDFVLRAVDDVPILIVGLLRAEEGERDTRALLIELANHPRTVSLSLGGLSVADVERLVTLAVGWGPGTELLQAFHRQTAGNPFFVAELLRLLIIEGTIDDVAATNLETLLPKGVQDVLQRRLGRLSAAARSLLDGASILGLEPDEAVLRGLTELGSDEFDRALAECDAARLVVRSADLPIRLNHALLRATVLADLDPERRSHLHLLAAALLEASDQRGERSVTGDIAYHLAEALPRGDVVKAAAYALQAGEQAVSNFAWEDAIRHFDRGLRMCDESLNCFPDLLPPLAIGLGDALVALARRAEGIASYKHAVQAAGTPSTSLDSRKARVMVALIHRRIALAHLDERQLPEALRAFDMALTQLPEKAHDRDRAEWELWLEVQLSRAEAYYYGGLLEEMSLLLQTLGPLAESYGTLMQQADLLAAQTALVLRASRYRPGPEAVTTAAALLAARQAHDPGGPKLASAHFWLGFAHLLRDDFKEARINLEAARCTARRIGDRILETQASIYLSQLERRLGLVQATRARAKQTLATATKAGLPSYAAAAQGDLAWVLMREGHALEARAQALEALKAWETEAPWPFEWLARFPLATVALSNGALDEVGDQFRAVLRPTQQVLPFALTAAITKALETLEAESADAIEALTAALTEARTGNYT